jgi:small subunit ribosomal protein S3Ae
MGSKQKKEAKRTTRQAVKAQKKKRLLKKTQLTKRRKSWYSILAPQLFGKAKIGESIVEEASSLVGRTVSLSLMTLTGDMKKQNTTINFEVAGIADNHAQTKAVGYYIVPASIKRMVRRGRTRVDASFVCKTKDGVHLRVKPFVLTLNVTNRATAGRVRNHVVTFLASYAAANDYETIFKEVVSGKVQMISAYVARKVYPVRSAGIRVLEVVEDEVTAIPQKDLDVAKLIKTAEAAPRPRYKTVRPKFPFNKKKPSSRGRGARR